MHVQVGAPEELVMGSCQTDSVGRIVKEVKEETGRKENVVLGGEGDENQKNPEAMLEDVPVSDSGNPDQTNDCHGAFITETVEQPRRKSTRKRGGSKSREMDKETGLKRPTHGLGKTRKGKMEEDQELDEVDHLGLNRLKDLQDSAGAVISNAAAGNLLLLMKFENNYVSRSAQLEMIKKTIAKPILERLVSRHLLDVLIKWIKEGESNLQSTFLLSVVDTIAHLPIPPQYQRASGLQTAVNR